MKPKKFKEANVVFAENQDEYLNLPAHRSGDATGGVISCWTLSFRERLRVFFFGEVWLRLLTFNGPLQPVFLTVDKKDLFGPDQNNLEVKENEKPNI